MKIIWVITDGSAGMRAQGEALAEVLGLPYEAKTCIRARPWPWLPNAWDRHPFQHLAPESDALEPPWPDLVITCGRRSAPLGAAIRKASSETKAVHLQHPRMGLRLFDLVAPMEHDGLSGSNVFSTRFALHSVTYALLAEAAEQWAPRFAALKRPWTAVLFGGSTNRYRLTAKRMKEALARLQAVPGSPLITPSRRTGKENIAILQQAFRGHGFVYDLEGDNPYYGLLALADYVVVTNDSVNMMTEAAATGKPLYILKLPGHENTPPARFAEMLIAEGIARPLGAPWESWSYAIPNEATRVAEAVRKLL